MHKLRLQPNTPPEAHICVLSDFSHKWDNYPTIKLNAQIALALLPQGIQPSLFYDIIYKKNYHFIQFHNVKRVHLTALYILLPSPAPANYK